MNAGLPTVLFVLLQIEEEWVQHPVGRGGPNLACFPPFFSTWPQRPPNARVLSVSVSFDAVGMDAMGMAELLTRREIGNL